MPDALEIVARFTADTGDLEQGAKKASGALDGIGVSSTAMIVGATGAIAALGAMTVAAAEDEAGQAQLETAIKAAGAATGDYTDQVNAAIAAGQAKAFSDDQTRSALQSLVTATGSVTEATGLLSAAQDIARFAGVDLATAADAVAKAQAGNAGALQKLIPGLEKSASATDTLKAATEAAAGSADAYAQTTQGSLAIAGDSFGELSETIGSTFLPIVKTLAEAMTGIASLMQQNAGLVQALAAVVAVLAAGILAANIAMKAFEAIQVAVKVATAAWTAVQWLLNVALNANPIGLVVIAIVALVAILAVAWQNSETFRKIVTGAFNAVSDAIQGVVKWIQDLLDWVSKAVNAVGSLIDSINPLKGFQLPSISLPFSAPAPATTAAARGARSTRQAGVTNVTINTSADPEAVVRALQRWAGNNGGRGTFLRALDRAAG
jgi:hypothetical protein